MGRGVGGVLQASIFFNISIFLLNEFNKDSKFRYIKVPVSDTSSNMIISRGIWKKDGQCLKLKEYRSNGEMLGIRRWKGKAVCRWQKIFFLMMS